MEGKFIKLQIKSNSWWNKRWHPHTSLSTVNIFDAAASNHEIGEEASVMSQLKEMPNVVEVHIVYGVYDLIAKIEAEDTDSLKKIVTENLRVLEKVRSTMTMICVDQ